MRIHQKKSKRRTLVLNIMLLDMEEALPVPVLFNIGITLSHTSWSKELVY